MLANAPFHSYRGQCTYCGHCKPCAAELDIAMINKFYDLATMQPEVPATIQSHYELLGHTASECIGCHACKRAVRSACRSPGVWSRPPLCSAAESGITRRSAPNIIAG